MALIYFYINFIFFLDWDKIIKTKFLLFCTSLHTVPVHFSSCWSVTNGTDSKGLSGFKKAVTRTLIIRKLKCNSSARHLFWSLYMCNSRFQKSCLLAFDSFPERFSEANLDKVLYFSVYGMSDGLWEHWLKSRHQSIKSFYHSNDLKQTIFYRWFKT